MLGTIIEALKSIIDLLKKGREDRKLRLEIERLEREKQEHQRIIQPATFDDVKAFDPKFNLLQKRGASPELRPKLAKSRVRPIWAILIAVLIGGIIVFFAWLLLRT